MFFEVVDAVDIKLESIPKSFSIFVREEKKSYKLSGIINFDRPDESEQKEINILKLSRYTLGHYTAICPDKNTWRQYDSILGIEFSKKKKNECFPSLLVYNIVNI